MSESNSATLEYGRKYSIKYNNNPHAPSCIETEAFYFGQTSSIPTRSMIPEGHVFARLNEKSEVEIFCNVHNGALHSQSEHVPVTRFTGDLSDVVLEQYRKDIQRFKKNQRDRLQQ